MKSTNLRLLTVNCCGIRTNKAEFAAELDYTKPDLVCGTESWLRGIKPGQDPAKNSIKSSEVFPRNTPFIGMTDLLALEGMYLLQPEKASSLMLNHN